MKEQIPVTFEELERLVGDRRRYQQQKTDAEKRIFNLEIDLNKAKTELNHAKTNITETESRIRDLAVLLGKS